MSLENGSLMQAKNTWPREVIFGSPGGFCAGVDRAVDSYREFVQTFPAGTVYSVGEPAHNPHVIH